MAIERGFELISNQTLMLYSSFRNSLPRGWVIAVETFVLIVAVSLLCIFIWLFYASLSKRDFLRIDMRGRHASEYFSQRKFSIISYFVKYLIFTPFLVILWFMGLSIMLLFLNRSMAIGAILTSSAVIVGVIRILSYYNNEAAEEVAKIVPFALIALFLMSSLGVTFTQVLSQLAQIPVLFDTILVYIGVLVFVEVVMRLSYATRLFVESQTSRKMGFFESLNYWEQRYQE